MRILVALVVVFWANMAIAELQFPSLDADDLNGRAVSLPQDFPGDPTIVFIAYKRNQQPSINAWVARLGLQERGGPAWVELPVVGAARLCFAASSIMACAPASPQPPCADGRLRFIRASVRSIRHWASMGATRFIPLWWAETAKCMCSSRVTSPMKK